ncbi:MAG: hypothetical protein WC680_02470 [Sulfuricurvum sp.]|jgi:hypothetical protein
MRPIIYILILALVAMFYKTFYYDYQKKEVSAETNASLESAPVVEVKQSPVVQEAAVQPAPEVKSNTADEQNRTGWQSRKGMPIDRLGDSIAGSLKDKIK